MIKMKNIKIIKLRGSKIISNSGCSDSNPEYDTSFREHLCFRAWKLFIIVFSSGLLLMSCSTTEDRSDAYGNFEATEITIAAQAAGELLQFNLEEGEFIKSDRLIGYIDSTDLVLKKQQLFSQIQAVHSKFANLDAQIEVFEQQKINVMRDKDRIQKMFIDGAATQKQVDDIQGQVDVIKKQIKSIKAQRQAVNAEQEVIRKQIDLVNESIKKSVIINPLDGVVLTKYVNAFEMVGIGKPLYKIADLREMKLKVYVSGAQLPDLKIGQEVEVLVDKNKTENSRFNGTISWISESAEFTPKIIQTKKERVNLVYAVKVRVRNDGSLKIGMPGEVNFQK
jgi:HlyD family secretion protein